MVIGAELRRVHVDGRRGAQSASGSSGGAGATGVAQLLVKVLVRACHRSEVDIVLGGSIFVQVGVQLEFKQSQSGSARRQAKVVGGVGAGDVFNVKLQLGQVQRRQHRLGQLQPVEHADVG